MIISYSAFMRRFLAQNALALSGIVLCLAGCGKSEIKSYDVPKEELDGLLTASRTPEQAMPQINWVKPEDWESLPLTAFRKANFQYSPEDSQASVNISIASLPGEAGRLLPTANKWRAQLNLKPVSRSDLQRSLARSRIADLNMSILDIQSESSSEPNLRTLGVFFRYRTQPWQIKMTGDSQLVEDQIGAFYALLQNISFTSLKANDQENETLDTIPNIVFDAPEAWNPQPNSSYRLASYSIEKEGHPAADFSITAFQGESADLMLNVNRWRRQLGLNEWTSGQINRRSLKIDSEELKFVLFDLKPETDLEKENTSQRILAAIMQEQNASWFFKIKGDPFLVETQRNRFTELLKSVRFESE